MIRFLTEPCSYTLGNFCTLTKVALKKTKAIGEIEGITVTTDGVEHMTTDLAYKRHALPLDQPIGTLYYSYRTYVSGIIV